MVAMNTLFVVNQDAFGLNRNLTTLCRKNSPEKRGRGIRNDSHRSVPCRLLTIESVINQET